MSLHGYRGFLDKVGQFLVEASGEQISMAIDEAADRIVALVVEGRVLYVFGASHAGLLVQDLFYRAGGLVPIQPILPRELMLDVKPVTGTSRLEQTHGVAATILEDVRLGVGDVVLVVSVSGRNAVPVELAMLARDRGATVIALTNTRYSSSVTGRGGPRLFEVADIVIDLPGVVGDACVELEEGLPRVGPSSSSVGAAILHGLMVEVSGRLLAAGVTPPIFASANLDDSAAWNDRVIAEYRDRVDYLGK